MLSSDLIAQIKFLELKAKRLATDVLTGSYASAFHGRGLDFQEVREYSPGDDVRAIDWNVTARTSVPHIKIYREERELTVMLAVDVSPSLRDDGPKSMMRVACELAAVIAWLAIRNNDRVGLILFSDQIEFYSPPKKGRAHVWSLIKALYTHEGKGRTTNLKGVLEYLEKTQKRRSTCFVISDFWAENFEGVLKRCARQHDLTCVAVTSPKSESLPDAGLVRWIDSETGETFMVDSSNSAVRSAYFAASKQRAVFKDMIVNAGADFFEVSTAHSVVRPLVDFLRGHGHKSFMPQSTIQNGQGQKS